MSVLHLLEFLDPVGDVMVSRVPEEGSAIRLGSQLVVRQTQVAIFCKDGKFFDKFSAGRYTLESNNLPLLGSVISLPYGKSPFAADVYFVGKQVFTGLGWGTQSPIVMRDSVLRMITIRAHGAFSIKIDDELLFLAGIVGTKGLQTTFAIEAFLRSIIISSVAEVVGEQLDTIFDLSKQYRKISKAVQKSIREDFSQYGLKLVDFFIEAITPTPEVQAMIDKASGMAAQDVERYSTISTADASVLAAKNTSGNAGEGIGAGLGVGLGLSMAQQVLGGSSDKAASSEKFGTISQDTSDPVEKLNKLKTLLSEEVISQEEYEVARGKVLDDL